MNEVLNNIEIQFNIKNLNKVRNEIGEKLFEERYREFFKELFDRMVILMNEKNMGHIQIVNKYDLI